MGSHLQQAYLKSMYFFRFGVAIYFASLFINTRAQPQYEDPPGDPGGSGGNAEGNSGKL